MPLVIATGAGASARKSIGITVFTGMIASTCLAVLFVPSLFVVIQRFEEWLQGRKNRSAGDRGGGVTRRALVTNGAVTSQWRRKRPSGPQEPALIRGRRERWKTSG